MRRTAKQSHKKNHTSSTQTEQTLNMREKHERNDHLSVLIYDE